MVEHDTEDVIQSQRVNEHKNILDMIDMLSKRLRKLEDVVPVTLQTTLERQDNDIDNIIIKGNDNRARLYTVEYNIKDIDSCLESIQRILTRMGKHVDKEEANNGSKEDELKRHCKDAHISQGQVKKWIHELYSGEVKKIEEAKNGKD